MRIHWNCHAGVPGRFRPTVVELPGRFRPTMVGVVVGTVLLLTATQASAGDPGSDSPSIDVLAWMEGHWVREGDGWMSEELWLPASTDAMVGLNRTTSGGEMKAFEYLRLVTTADGIDYIAQPGGKPGTPFRLTEWSQGRAVFENPEHDFPQRITYVREGETLTAQISGVVGAEEKESEWSWELVE